MAGLGKVMEQGFNRRVITGLFMIFILALGLRMSVMFYIHNFDTVDGYENEEVARNLIEGHGWSMSLFGPRQPSAYVYPFYIAFLYVHFRVFGINFLPVELSQAVIGSLGAVLLFFLGSRLFDRRAGWLAAVASACYPVYAYWACRAQALVLEIFLLELLLLVWIWAMDKHSARLYALSGLIFGLAGLSKTLYLALFPLFIIWFWLSRRAGARDLLKAAVISGIVSMIVISPWSIRNYLVFREFIPVNLNNGYNLWVGNNPNATGSLFTRDRVGMWETMPEDMRDKLARMNDVEKNELFREKAVSYIKSHPDRFFKLIPQKLLFLWWFDPYMPTDFPGLREAIYLALLIPALIGMVISRRRFRGVSIFYMIYLELSFIYSIYYGSVRFRYLIEFSFILFASVTGIWIYDKLMALKQRKNINRRGR